MAGLKFYNTAQTFSTTLDVPEPTATTVVTMPSSGTVATESQVIGVGQTWQDLTASRANGVVYTNTTGKMIKVSCRFEIGAASAFALFIDPLGTPLSVDSHYNNTASGPVGITFQCEVPDGVSYEALVTAGTATKTTWFELR